MTMFNVRTTMKTSDGLHVREATVVANHVGAAIQHGCQMAEGNAFSVVAEPIGSTTVASQKLQLT